MLVGVISDIHGNDTALQAALEDLERHEVEQIVCLGDVVQGGCQPRQVLDRMKALGCPIVLGNTDAFVLDSTIGEDVTGADADRLRLVRDWTVEQIGEDGLAFLRSFVPTHEIDLDGGGTLLCFHGSPRSYDDVLLPETPRTALHDVLTETDANVLCGGHTHLQWTRTIAGKTFFNPGSVGVVYNRSLPPDEAHFYPIAEFAIVTAGTEGVSIDFKHVMVDVDALREAARRSGHPFAETEALRYTPPSKR